MAFVASQLSGSGTRKCGLKNVLCSLVVFCVLWIIIVQYLRMANPSISGYLESGIDNEQPRVDIVDLQTKEIIDRENLNNKKEEYVFVVPRSAESRRTTDIDIHKEVFHLLEILKSFPQYDGATCHGFAIDQTKDRVQKLKSCWFETRNWTMLISGPNKERNVGQKQPWLLVCNMVEYPFIIRQSVLDRLGNVNKTYGEAALLNFFLRSNGTLRLAASQKCIFPKKQSKIDPESVESKRQVYLDYGLLGYQHNILRIIRQNSITWTKCSYQNTSCPDIPDQESRINNILLPYCCKTLLNQILIHTSAALDQIGVEYRVGFGTLLGAIRSKTIIPWTQDADFCLTSKDSHIETFKRLKEALKPTSYAYAHRIGMHRIVPLNAIVKHIANHSLVSKSDLFSEQTLRYMKEMLPIPEPFWTRYPYADFYRYNKIFQRNRINVNINGQEYPTGDRPHELLREWFGNKYMSTDREDRTTSGAVDRKTLLDKIRKLFLI